MNFPKHVPAGPVAALAGCILLGALGSARNGTPLLLVGVLSAAVACFPAYRLATGRECDPFAPIHLFVLYLAITVHVRAVVIRTGNSGILTPLYDTSGTDVAWLLTLALASSGVFLACLYVGYYGGLAERVCSALPRFEGPPGTRTNVWVAALFSIGIAAPIAILLWTRIGASVATGRFTEETRAGGVFWMGYLLRFAVVGSLIPYFASLRHGTPGTIARRAVLAISAAVLVFVLFPKKIVIANQLLLLLVGYHYLRRRIAIRTLALSGGAGLLALPLLSQFRYAGFAGFSPTRLMVLMQAVWEKPALLVQTIFLRTFGADSLMLIFDKLRVDQQYTFGGTLREALWWYVPRGMWPEKPLTYAITFGQEYLARSSFFSVNVSGTPTVIGELILTFGPAGLIVGAILVGLLLRLPFAYLVDRRMSFGAALLYGTFLAGSVMLVEGPIEPQLLDVSVSVVIVAVLLGVMEATQWAARIWRRLPIESVVHARRD